MRPVEPKSASAGPREGADAVAAHLAELADLAARAAEALSGEVAQVAEMAVDTLAGGGKLLFCGNGGSAADAQHLASEYVVRFRSRRAGLAALALTVDTSVLTAVSNDMGYASAFARQVEALGRPGDLLFLHSTSGESDNLLRAAEAARGRAIRTAALLARDGGRLRRLVDRAIVVPTQSTARAQELHLAIGHAICDAVDRAFAGGVGEGRTR
ncbi:MAG: SIS domain-containing protein [Gemmatimonadetes bacterium]|nr:SIS domain-containing protein [Gemmatimonadota bacterium]NIR79268.1 SIS domain-containing protein [Gemmatimonadota bacterium]NIT86587.1 SIS domain-containing protein [Gemmatimonadota bacterium]NIU30437.1 SIS domain-containing protein [Gemmatimonadota bacterium]NIU36398.1 SIS domain-containing protein [Gemmatimonadota bacterium]